ncbi:LacI family DNA-binding transcriptional regulator [Streptomyces sp.]|uniref:LacI family DNA-binding transcriptional regulator n=1 Tax=Streptomyces sp. TaxID=1931 RepID=UPI002F40F6EC
MARAPRTRTGRVTMQDVADRAGVSLATASFAINRKETTKVSDTTRRHVQAVAAELGYRPNAMARNLSKARTSFIGLITDSIATTPFAGQLIRGAQDAAREHDHVLLIANTESDSLATREAIGMMLDHQVRGVVYSTWYHRQVRLPSGLSDVPLVLANCFTGDDRVQSFVPDETEGGRAAANLLLDRGHRRVAFINSTERAPSTVGRLRGYRTALREHGIAYDPGLVLPTYPPDQRGGYDAGRRLLSLRPRPTAVFCYNDRVAMGLYDALREEGVRIPEDLAVVGFDNQEIIAGYLRPTLSSVGLPHYELGHRSLTWLLTEGLGQQLPEPTRTLLPCPTVERHSVQPLPG